MPEVIGRDNLPTIEEVSGDGDDLGSLFREAVYLKKNIDDLTKRQDVIKKRLSDFVDGNGLEDDKGHKWFDMPEVDGYVGMQRQRRVAQSVDEAVCQTILGDKELMARCFELKPVLNQDEVLACFYEGLITEDELDMMFPKKVTSAFILMKK